MEYLCVVNGRAVRVSGEEASWHKFSLMCEAVKIANKHCPEAKAWAELRLMNGEPIARFDENGMSECGAVRGM